MIPAGRKLSNPSPPVDSQTEVPIRGFGFFFSRLSFCAKKV